MHVNWSRRDASSASAFFGIPTVPMRCRAAAGASVGSRLSPLLPLLLLLLLLPMVLPPGEGVRRGDIGARPAAPLRTITRWELLCGFFMVTYLLQSQIAELFRKTAGKGQAMCATAAPSIFTHVLIALLLQHLLLLRRKTKGAKT